MGNPEKRWWKRWEAVWRARAVRRYAVPALMVLAGVAGAYRLLESETAIEDKPRPGEMFYVDLESGDLMITPKGEVQYYARVLTVNGYPRRAGSIYGDWDSTPEARLPWGWMMMEEGIEFKPWIECYRYWFSPAGGFRGNNEIKCGVRYIRIKPEGEDKIRVEVHFDEVGMFWRVVHWAQKGAGEAGTMINKVKRMVADD